MRRLWFAVLGVLMMACADVDDTRADSELHAHDEAARAAENALPARKAAIVDHGSLSLPTEFRVELRPSAPVHVFRFTLTAPARVSVRTQPAESLREVDTVLTLFRTDDDVRQRPLARNDDLPGTLYSGLTRELAAASYEVEVRGYSRRSVGAFSLSASCEGVGCKPPVPPLACPFGSQFSDLFSSTRIRAAEAEWIRTEAQLGSELEREQLVVAVQQSSHTDVTTVLEALERVDEHEVRRVPLLDTLSGRTYTAYEYGAGDNSYGAIFPSTSTELAASIHDGDLIDCEPDHL